MMTLNSFFLVCNLHRWLWEHVDVVKKHGDVALRDVVCGPGGDGLGLDLMISEAFSNLIL